MVLNKSILVFGVGELQKSIIGRAKRLGLFVVGIDPCADVFCRNDVDAFEVVDGQDFEGTLAVARRYNISAVITAATDKPLVMMARVARKLGLRFYSEDTALWSTDKFLMKQHFIENGVSCARGRLIKSAQEAETLTFPLILKPRDNSGSRGVILCRDIYALRTAIEETRQYTHFDSVLVEEYIVGQEYSIESLHYNGKTEVVQYTQKKTTEFPYNVELGHKQPADISEEQRSNIQQVIEKIAESLHFENCASHTELKINDLGIFVIETSPRLGGDYITSTLVPLSCGINMEDQLILMALGEKIDTTTGRINKASAVCFFSFPEGKITAIDPKISDVSTWPNIYDFQLKLNVGDPVNKITSSLNRYGQFIIHADTSARLNELSKKYENAIRQLISIEPCANS